MSRLLTALCQFTVCLSAFAAPGFAADAAKGENDYKKCKACHSIIKDDGTEVVKGGRTGPNLFGLIGRPVGATDFAYSKALKSAGTMGLVWDEAMLVAYVADPSKWLKEQTGDATAKSKMTFKLAKGVEDISAYLAAVK